jgi:predicted dehydrogenase
MDTAELVGVYDIDQDVGRRIAQNHDCKLFSSADETIDSVEAVSIATPTADHFELAWRFLEAGKHVLVEKPITHTTEEATRLVELAAKHGRILQVGHIERFNPVLSALEQRLTRARFIEAHRLSPYPGRSTDISVVMDLMIHDLEIILHLVKSPVASIDAAGVAVLSLSEDIANARIRFQNGCVANVTTSRISPEKMRKIRVFQDDAYLSLDYQKQSGEIYYKEGAKIVRDPIPIAREEPLGRELSSFIDSVRNGDNPVVSGHHAAEALKLAARIVESIAIPGPA